MPYEEWCKKRITEAKVLAYLRQTLERQQTKPQKDVIALVKKGYDFVYKGYSLAFGSGTVKMRRKFCSMICSSMI